MRSVLCVSGLLCVISAAACGDDDGNSGTGGVSATGGSGGSGGSAGDNDAGGGTGGSGATGGSGGTAGFPSIMCGALTCAPSLIAPACCTAPGTGVPGDPLELAGRAPNQCGTDLGYFADAAVGICLQLRQPGTLDDSCPDVPNMMPGQPPFPGCCSDEGFCGGNERFLPLGCIYSAGGRGRPCGANVDAGTNDAGH